MLVGSSTTLPYFLNVVPAKAGTHTASSIGERKYPYQGKDSQPPVFAKLLPVVMGPGLRRDDAEVVARAGRPYAFSVSRNRTGSPCEAVTSSPCHITRRPRMKVPTGQPVTRTPS